MATFSRTWDRDTAAFPELAPSDSSGRTLLGCVHGTNTHEKNGQYSIVPDVSESAKATDRSF